MIAVDTSAIIAIGLREDRWEDCFVAVRSEPEIVMSAVTLAEIFVVSAHRRVQSRMRTFVSTLSAQVVPVTYDTAFRIGEIYERWGKGFHPAALNYCDCFAYDVARQFDCPLLYVGNDFSQTDIPSALA